MLEAVAAMPDVRRSLFGPPESVRARPYRRRVDINHLTDAAASGRVEERRARAHYDQVFQHGALKRRSVAVKAAEPAFRRKEQLGLFHRPPVRLCVLSAPRHNLQGHRAYLTL